MWPRPFSIAASTAASDPFPSDPFPKETRMPATHPMTLPREGTTLVIVDVQERLFPAMDADHREEVMRNIKILATAARRLRRSVRPWPG